jgi:hypothetical protein
VGRPLTRVGGHRRLVQGLPGGGVAGPKRIDVFVAATTPTSATCGGGD